MEKRKLGVLLSTDPSHPSVRTVSHLCKEALDEQIDVFLYLIDEGVKNLHNSDFLHLSKSGAKFFVCAYGCQQHGISTDNLDSHITLCGLVVLSNMMNGCDRFIAFN